jgi:hypothetical protein
MEALAVPRLQPLRNNCDGEPQTISLRKRLPVLEHRTRTWRARIAPEGDPRKKAQRKRTRAANERNAESAAGRGTAISVQTDKRDREPESQARGVRVAELGREARPGARRNNRSRDAVATANLLQISLICLAEHMNCASVQNSHRVFRVPEFEYHIEPNQGPIAGNRIEPLVKRIKQLKKGNLGRILRKKLNIAPFSGQCFHLDSF